MRTWREVRYFAWHSAWQLPRLTEIRQSHTRSLPLYHNYWLDAGLRKIRLFCYNIVFDGKWHARNERR